MQILSSLMSQWQKPTLWSLRSAERTYYAMSVTLSLNSIDRAADRLSIYGSHAWFRSIPQWDMSSSARPSFAPKPKPSNSGRPPGDCWLSCNYIWERTSSSFLKAFESSDKSNYFSMAFLLLCWIESPAKTIAYSLNRCSSWMMNGKNRSMYGE